MQQPDPRAYLFDIQKACGLIQQFVAGKSLSDYERDAEKRSAVERQFEIAGEAVRQLLRVAPEVGARLTAAPQIIAFRNYLIHSYAAVQNEIVWGVVEEDLPVLAREVTGLLAELGGPLPSPAGAVTPAPKK